MLFLYIYLYVFDLSKGIYIQRVQLHNIELYCPTCKSNVSLEHLAHGIAFVNVPQINEGLPVEEVIRQGGFGKVYKGISLLLLHPPLL